MRYYKDITNLLFWVLWACLATYNQSDLSTCWKRSCLSAGKISTSSPSIFFWRYCKDMHISYFGYFGHVWLRILKMIVSTRRKFRCLSVCRKYFLSFTSLLRHYILRNSAIWLANTMLVLNSGTRKFATYEIDGEISMTILVFILDYFLEKLTTKSFKKSKWPYFGTILGPFSSNLGKNEFSWKKGSVSFYVFQLSTIM